MRLDPDIERRAARFAAAHHAYLPLEDALALGHTPETLEARADRGELEREWRGLNRVAGAPRTWQGDTYAAVRAGPSGAVASHLSAAALFGLWTPPPLPHIIVRRGSNVRLRLARVHRSPLDDRDRTVVGVIPATRVARTVVDCAGLLPFSSLCDLVDAARVSGKARAGAIEEAMERAGTRPGRKGLPALRKALAVWAPGIERDSVAEARMFRLIATWGLPPPVTLHTIRDLTGQLVCEADAAWPEFLVALDYDSPEHHHPRHWGRDERRHAAAKALGWTFVSVDKTDLMPGSHRRLRSELTELLRPTQAGAPTRQVGG